MNDISKEQQDKYIIEALAIAGFEENTDFPGIFRKEHGKDAIAVDLTAGQSVYFIIDKQKEVKDDDRGTLALISSIIIDAIDGKMPSQTKADMQYNKEAAPEPQAEVPTDTKDIPEPTHDITPMQQLVPLSPNIDIVRPVVSAAQAIAAWNEFQALQKAILEPSDFQRIGDKEYKKKSAWRKFAAFFNLNDKIVEEIQTPHVDKQGWTWKIKVICTAPNGRFTEGIGMCSTSERGFAHLEHDTYATAHTRAKNRAISDMVAAGEVSAEEMKS